MTETTLTCPRCGAAQRAEIPDDQCVWFYDCVACSARLAPESGDCCVFCSYAGDT